MWVPAVRGHMHAAFEVGLSLDQGQGIYSGWSDVVGSSQLRLCHTCMLRLKLYNAFRVLDQAVTKGGAIQLEALLHTALEWLNLKISQI